MLKFFRRFHRRVHVEDAEEPLTAALTLDNHNLLVPCVLIVGDFRGAQVVEFAEAAWKEIHDHYIAEGRAYFGAPPSLNTFREDNVFCPVPFDQTQRIDEGTCLFPIPVNDFGRADGPSFQIDILNLFKSHNIVGVISCCTAEANIGLADALRFIDIPVLLVLDSTLNGPERFVPNARELISGNITDYEMNAEGYVPNALQLIPNNALQAQAILSKVGMLFTTRRSPVFHLLSSPDDDPYVDDLRSAVESNLEETNRSKIRLDQIDLNKFQVRKNSVLLCIGYNDLLEQLPKPIMNCDLLLSDGFDNKAAESEQIELLPEYYQIRPVFDPLEHALYAYKVFNRLWRDARELNPDDLHSRLQSKIRTVREILEHEYGDRYRFVGVTNQRGGFYAEKTKTRPQTKAARRRMRQIRATTKRWMRN